MGLSDVYASLKSFFDVLMTLPQSEGFGYTLRYLSRGTPLYLRLTTVVAAVLSLVLGTVSYLNFTEANSSLIASLISPWDRSDLPHTGLESFLVTTLLSKDDWLGLQAVGRAKVRPSFKDGISRLEESVKSFDGNGKLTLDGIEIAVSHMDPGSNLFLTDRQYGFLFVPGVQLTNPGSLRGRLTQIIRLDEKDTTPPIPKHSVVGHKIRLAEDRDVLVDVALSQSAAEDLCGNQNPSKATIRDLNASSSATVFEGSPAILAGHFTQAYLIFQSGVARLCEFSMQEDFSSQRKFYGVRFKPYTLLQERPYFQGTVGKSFSPSDSTVSELFFESGPYMDIAGNGIVDTFCRYIPVNAVDVSAPKRESYRTDAVLCFDFNLKKNLGEALVPRIVRYGGSLALVECQELHCTREGEPERPPWYSRDHLLSVFFTGASIRDEDIVFVDDKFKDSQRAGSTSDILGRVGTFPLDESRMLFTVPLGAEKILVGKLDLSAYQTRSFVLLLLAGVAASVTVLLFFLGIADYGLKIKEQQRAFDAVDKVMTDVDIPYMRVDEDGKINHVNNAAARKLGYASANSAQAQLRNTTFEDLFADGDSLEEYKRVKEQRATGGEYRSYRVKLWSDPLDRTRSEQFDVHGWDVPAPHISNHKPGQSFGILVPVPPEPVTPVRE